MVTPGSWNLIGTTGAFAVPQGNTLHVSPALTWPQAPIPATGHYCFVAVLSATGDPAPILPGPTDWNGFLGLIRNENNVTWRNFNVVDVIKSKIDPIEMAFVVPGAPDQVRRFDFEIVANLPGDVEVEWQVPPALAAALPEHVLGWRSKRGEDRSVGLRLPRLRSLPLCGVHLGPNDRFATRLVVRPSGALAAGLHTIAVRQFYGDLEVGRITWALRPAAAE